MVVVVVFVTENQKLNIFVLIDEVARNLQRLSSHLNFMNCIRPRDRQAEWLKTAKTGVVRIPVGTVVRLADGVESEGPLKVNQPNSIPSTYEFLNPCAMNPPTTMRL